MDITRPPGHRYLSGKKNVLPAYCHFNRGLVLIFGLPQLVNPHHHLQENQRWPQGYSKQKLLFFHFLLKYTLIIYSPPPETEERLNIYASRPGEMYLVTRYPLGSKVSLDLKNCFS